MLKKVEWVGERGGFRVVMNKELVTVKNCKLKLRGVRSRDGVGVRVDANDELKLLSTCKKKKEEKRLGWGPLSSGGGGGV